MLEVPTGAITAVNVLETDIAHPVVGAQEIATVQEQNALFLSALTTVNVLETDIAPQVVRAQEKVNVSSKNQKNQNQKRYIFKSADNVIVLMIVSQFLAARCKHQSQLCHLANAPLLIHVILDLEIAMGITLVNLA